MIFIITDSHGYLKINYNQLETALKKGYKPTVYSFINQNNVVLLEEDCDAPRFLNIMFPKNTNEKWKSIKIKRQTKINKSKYDLIPGNLELFYKFKKTINEY